MAEEAELDMKWQRYRTEGFSCEDQRMKSMVFSFLNRLLLASVMFAAWCGMANADEARAGAVEWSDGHKVAGAISLTPGKDLRVFTADSQVALSLDEVKEIRFTPEKEEMWEGFYFPNAGQATQVKTGEVYPIRYLQTHITLGNGQVVEGHLFTTVFYVEPDEGPNEKVVVMAKQTGANGQKLVDLVYPTVIRFDAGGASAGSARIDLTQSDLKGIQTPLIFTWPDLSSPPVQQVAGKPIWTVPTDDPAKLLFSVEAADGIHVAWPDAEPDPDTKQAVDTGLKVMRDFYDSRTQLGCFADASTDDIYSLVMMKRLGKKVDGNGTIIGPDITPWSLVILRWKYDADQKKATLLNRVLLKIGRIDATHPEPKIFREPGLLRDISASK